MIIEISISTLSKKILEKEYGSLVKVNKRSVLFPMLYAPSSTQHLPHLTTLHSFQFKDINVKKKRDAFLKACEHGGGALHRYHLDKMETFVLAQVQRGAEGKESIRAFFSYYDLDDEDYDMDSAYRRLSRAKKNGKQSDFFNKKKNQAVSKYCRIYHQNGVLELLLGYFTSNYFDAFVAQRGFVLSKRMNQARCWIYYHIGGRSIDEISQLLTISERSVYRHIERINTLVNQKRLFPFPSLELIPIIEDPQRSEIKSHFHQWRHLLRHKGAH